MNEIYEEYGHDPIDLFKAWLTEAEDQELNDPSAFCLATCDKQGRPSARMVLMKDLSQQGIKFHTNANSRKGQDITDNPYGALCVHWKSLRKQIRAEGLIKPVETEETDAYFQTRSRNRQIGAWASQQSKNYETRNDLFSAIKESEDRFKDTTNIPRPEYWQGFRLIPKRYEFWIGNRDRLHTRFEYILDNEKWTARWMYP